MYLLIPWSVFRNSVILTAIGSPWGKEGKNGMEENLQPNPLVQLSYSYSHLFSVVEMRVGWNSFLPTRILKQAAML